MSIESMMLPNHLILCCPLLLLPSIFPSVRVFSNELVPCIRKPEYCSLVYLDEAQLYPLIEEEVEKILQGNLQGKKLQGEKLSCIVRVQDTSIKYKQLIIIEI